MAGYTLRKPPKTTSSTTKMSRKSYEASIEFVALNVHAERSDSAELISQYSAVNLLAHQYSADLAVIVRDVVDFRKQYGITVG